MWLRGKLVFPRSRIGLGVDLDLNRPMEFSRKKLPKNKQSRFEERRKLLGRKYRCFIVNGRSLLVISIDDDDATASVQVSDAVKLWRQGEPTS